MRFFSAILFMIASMLVWSMFSAKQFHDRQPI
jgi:hypothetical protein